MPRANRIFQLGMVWHVTHRCHQREFLLRFLRDRRRWRHWVFQAKRRYGFCVLNYIATSNHIHLLIADQGNGEIATSMQLIAGRVAQEYNRRKNRKGAFWEDRYHATAVQTDEHLIRCLSYIDLNMVRAGVVEHPFEWDTSGYCEIQNPPVRKGIIDLAILGRLAGLTSIKQLQRMHRNWTNSAMKSTVHDPVWTKCAAVGDKQFLSKFKDELGVAGLHKKIVDNDDVNYLMETNECYLPFSQVKWTD